MNGIIAATIVWLIVGAWLLRQLGKQKEGTVGLAIAYFVLFAMVHIPGALAYLDPGFAPSPPWIVEAGYELATWAIVAFAVGVYLANRFPLTLRQPRGKLSSPRLYRLAISLYVFGLFTEIVLMPVLGRVPTLTAVLAGFTNVSIAGVCLGLYGAFKSKSAALLRHWTLLTLLFPLISLIGSAFLGAGVYSMIVVVCFAYFFARRVPPRYILVGIGLIYVGLSFFVVYLDERDELRRAVWIEGRGFEHRVDSVMDMFSKFEWFDPSNRNHLEAIDRRLNQNFFLGLAKTRVESGQEELAGGRTFVFAITGLIPRVIWPNKPSIGGGGDIVADYTGLTFRNTSVGVGQVFEFYINFGFIGVLLGMAIFGGTVQIVDRTSARGLSTNNPRLFILAFLPGVAMMQVEGTMVEVTTSAVSSVLSALLIIYLFNRYFRVSSQKKTALA